eukprot:TRINITY_DN4023_c0_g1_i3.p1 TRINITY_DN4023_c0_g1~~TRINITY_DN4023_c0_g1_i3.p1  ORF type:complete len:152 (-),score=14.38 TRINITY_DN4023_c0_g1_i3:60-515(-)
MVHYTSSIRKCVSQRWVLLVTLPRFSQLFFLFVISCIFILIIFVISSLNIQASVEKNAREIKEYLEEIYWGSKKCVLLLGHSKGVDAAAALSMYWTDLKDNVAGLALAQSPYGGSPIASDILRDGQLGDYVNLQKLTEILICKVIKGISLL